MTGPGTGPGAEEGAATAIYVVLPGQLDAPHVRLALRRLRAAHDALIVIASPQEATLLAAGTAQVVPDHVIAATGALTTRRGYAQGLRALWTRGIAGSVLLTGGHVFGPLLGAAPIPPGDIRAASWHRPALDTRLSGWDADARVPSLDHVQIGAAALAHPELRAFWDSFEGAPDPWAEFCTCDLAFARLLARLGLSTAYPIAADRLETAHPGVYEVHRLVADGAPSLPLAALTLDPLLQDLNAIELRRALTGLRARDPEMHAAAQAFAVRAIKPRDFAAAADQYEILPHVPRDPEKSEWSFGEVAVFVHAYYAEMIAEFWALVRRLPCRAHLYLTTASAADQAHIAAYLTERGLGPDRFTVRVVAANRGRDMSSLFITWRDVVLSGRHKVALRLHSKRTPQVSRRVGESFKAHLFDNLIGSAGYVSNLLTLMDAEPDIGLVMPPVVHVGFGTLGHAWYNNREPLAALMRDMDIHVPLDDHTPLAPYGTMYWFRTDALIRLFEWAWRWEDYNAEPHHVDGGLAHVQERLIGYAARDRGYRIVTAMTPESAARNYAKLEYKLQRLAAELPSGNILHQVADLAAMNRAVRPRLFRRLRDIYGRLLIWRPEWRAPLLPIRTAVVSLLSPRAGG